MQVDNVRNKNAEPARNVCYRILWLPKVKLLVHELQFGGGIRPQIACWIRRDRTATLLCVNG